MTAVGPTRLRLLGEPAWAGADTAWQPLAGKDALLLARLALDGPQPRAEMAAWLWPQVPPPRANANLRQRLFRLRQAGAELVREDAATLHLAAGIACDTLALADNAAGVPDELADGRLPALLQTVTLEPDSRRSADLLDWLDRARQVCAAQALDRLARRAWRDLGEGSLAAALHGAERLLLLEPLREHSWRLLMRVHHQRGDRAAAINAFERCERLLREELGVRPAPETLALLDDCEALATTPGKGQALAGPLPPALLRPPRLVGRDGALARMAAAWQAGRPFAVVGDSGLGKSRLLADFAEQRPTVLRLAARPGDESLAYGVVARLLRQAMVSRSATPEQLLAALPDPGTRAELTRLLPELGPAPAAHGQPVLLNAALEMALAALAASGLEGLLVDDLHHADEASRELIWRQTAASGPLRWGLASRPERLPAPAMPPNPRLEWLTLDPLSDADAATLLASLGPLPGWPGSPDAAPSIQALQTRLVQHCVGNPLFLLETLKLLALQPALAESTRWPVPSSVQAVLDRRLECLSATGLALARLTAIAPGELPRDAIGSCLDRGPEALLAALGELHGAQLLTAGSGMHDVVRDAVLARWPAPMRSPLHARLAHALDACGGPAAAVARHALLGGDDALAANASLRAAAQARQLGRSAERLALLRQAADAWDRAGDGDSALQARLEAIEPVLAVDGLEAALTACDGLAAQAGNRPKWAGAVALVRAEVSLNGYRPEEAEAAARQALLWQLPGADPANDDTLRAHLLLAAALALRAQFEQALSVATPWLDALRQVSDPLRAATLWSQWALVQHAAGRLRPCLEALQQQRLWARQAADVAAEAQALSSLSGLQLALGDPEQSIAMARQAGDLHRRMGEEHSALLADVNLVIALIGCDRLLEAEGVLLRLGQLSARPAQAPDSQLAWIVPELQAEWHLRLNRPEAALACVATEAPVEAALTRRLNRGLIRAMALQVMGDTDRAVAAWWDLQHLAGGTASGLPPDVVMPRAGVQLRALALASVVLPATAARRQLDLLLGVAESASAPASSALVRLRRAAVALRAGDAVTALADVRWLLAQRDAVRHLYVSTAEVLSLAHHVAHALGKRTMAAQVKAAAQRWWSGEVSPQLPADGAPGWCRHPAHAGLFAAFSSGDGVATPPRAPPPPGRQASAASRPARG